MKEAPLYIVLNANAGSCRALRVWRCIERRLRAEGCEFVHVGDALPPEGSDVMLIGGDGTFCDFLNRVPFPEQYRYTLVPAGSSNSLYTTFGRERVGEFRKMDVGVLQTEHGSYRFLNEASLGFAAAIAAHTVDTPLKRVMNRMGMSELGYMLAAFGVWMCEPSMMINLLNNNRISANLRPIPFSRADDGVLDVCVLSCPRWRLPFELMRMVDATEPSSSRYVRCYRGLSWEHQFNTLLPVETDGEPREKSRWVRCSLYEKQITVRFVNAETE